MAWHMVVLAMQLVAVRTQQMNCNGASGQKQHCEHIELNEVWKKGQSFIQSGKITDRDGATDLLEDTISDGFPTTSFPVARNVYIESKAYPGKFLSVLRSTKGDAARLMECNNNKNKKLPGCLWKIQPSSTKSDHYYLKTSDTEQTLHATHYALGERATLYPCFTGDFPNCQWTLVEMSTGNYKIKVFGKDHFLAAPAEGRTTVTTQSCDGPDPSSECLWQVAQAACYKELPVEVEDEGDTVFSINPLVDLVGCEDMCASTVNCKSFALCGHEAAEGGGCWGKNRIVSADDKGKVSPGPHCKTYMEVMCDQSPITPSTEDTCVGDCPYCKPHEEIDDGNVHNNMPLCANGEYNWACESAGRGPRVQCPIVAPIMCAYKRCDGDTDYCCEVDCGTRGSEPFGGPRLCD